LLLGGAYLVAVGDGVECAVKGILQVVDETQGATTKRDYKPFNVPVGSSLIGKVVDFLGRPHELSTTTSSSSSSSNSPPYQQKQQIGTETMLPLLNKQPDMESREQINQPLTTGIRSLDIMTPLGKGQALQIVGTQSSGKTQLCIDTIAGQSTSNIRCVYAAVGATGPQLRRTLDRLQATGAMAYTTVVAATSDAPLGEQYAAMLAACSIAEATRDDGGNSLVVLNDAGVAVKMWERITEAMADLEVGVVLQVATDDVASIVDDSTDTTNDGDTSFSVPTSPPSITDEEDLVEYEGMLVSAAAAQRRRFFSSLIQRAAKMHRRLKGGSMTMLLVSPGLPATGMSKTAADKIKKYKHLSEEQKAKLLAALEKQENNSDSSSSSNSNSDSEEHSSPSSSSSVELRTEVIEELMSITDGQVVLMKQRDSVTGGGVVVNPSLSVSRIGSRAYPPALEELAPQVRFELAQAADALKFSANSTSVSSLETDEEEQQGEAGHKAATRAAVLAAAMPQKIGTTVPLEDQVVQLLALQRGVLDDVEVDKVQEKLREVTRMARQGAPKAMQEIAETKRLTAASKLALLEVLGVVCRG
jgi:F-type H+-transporting ATPase subunit alpha